MSWCRTAEKGALMSEICTAQCNRDDLKRHRQRLAMMKHSIKLSAPQRYPHLDLRLKQMQLEDDRARIIERDNLTLLKRIEGIAPQDMGQFGSNVTLPTTLNKQFRKREILRIMEENESMYRRIVKTKPTFDRREWTKHAQNAIAYKKNIAYKTRVPRIPAYKPRAQRLYDKAYGHSRLRRVEDRSNTAQQALPTLQYKPTPPQAEPQPPMSARTTTAPTTVAPPRQPNTARPATHLPSEEKEDAPHQSQLPQRSTEIHRSARLIDESYQLLTVEEVLSPPHMEGFIFYTYDFDSNEERSFHVTFEVIEPKLDEDLMSSENRDDLLEVLIENLTFANGKLCLQDGWIDTADSKDNGHVLFLDNETDVSASPAEQVLTMIISCRSLPKASAEFCKLRKGAAPEKINPFCALFARNGDGDKFTCRDKTQVQQNTQNPNFPEILTLSVAPDSVTDVSFCVFDVYSGESVEQRELLGQAEIPVSELLKHVNESEPFSLDLTRNGAPLGNSKVVVFLSQESDKPVEDYVNELKITKDGSRYESEGTVLRAEPSECAKNLSHDEVEDEEVDEEL